MNSINPVSFARTLPDNSDATPLDVMMQRYINRQTTSLVFPELRSTPTEVEPPPEQPTSSPGLSLFLGRFDKAVAEGKFIFHYDTEDASKASQQFGKDLGLLYSMLIPTKESISLPPTLKEIELWLQVLLVHKPQEEEIDSTGFKKMALISFCTVYKKNIEGSFEKMLENIKQGLMVDWESGDFQIEIDARWSNSDWDSSK